MYYTTIIDVAVAYFAHYFLVTPSVVLPIHAKDSFSLLEIYSV